MNSTPGIRSTFANSFNFRGRASRFEFWYFVVFYAVLLVPTLIINLGILDVLKGFWLVHLLNLTVLLPFLALSVRRFHDVGWNGLPVVAFWACCCGVYIYFHSIDPNWILELQEYNRHLRSDLNFWPLIIGFILFPALFITYILQFVAVFGKGMPERNAYGPPTSGPDGPLYREGYEAVKEQPPPTDWRGRPIKGYRVSPQQEHAGPPAIRPSGSSNEPEKTDT